MVGRLEALIAEEPLRERLHAQRMLALYRAGRQSEALEAYRQAHRTLIEQIGVEPGPELRRLQEQILAQDPALDAPAPPTELPRQLEGGSPLLAGRERELGWLRRRWAAGERRAGRLRTGLGARRGSARRGSSPSSRPRSRAPGAAVLYAGGGEVADAALATVAEAGKGHRPTLLVLDYADDAPPAVLEAAAALAREPEGRPLLICVLHHDEQGPPAFAALLESGAAQRLRLDPLGEDAAAEIAALYAPAEGVAMPLETLIAESEGVPLRIHRAAGEWARAEAAERLAATAGQAADDRSELRATQAAVAGSVVDLQTAARAHAPLRGRRAARSLRARRSVRSAAWRPSTPRTPSTSSAASASSPSSSPASSARPCWRWSAPPAAASPRRCAPGSCRRSPAGSFPARSAGAGR